MKLSHPSRVAVVTGAGRAEGIGFEVCRQGAAHVITVPLPACTHDRAVKRADQRMAEGAVVRPLAVDVIRTNRVKGLADELGHTFDKLDILLNKAAGVAPRQPLL